MVERDDLRAELLSDVVLWDDMEPDVHVAARDNTRDVKGLRSSFCIPLARDLKELRTRIDVLRNACTRVAS